MGVSGLELEVLLCGWSMSAQCPQAARGQGEAAVQGSLAGDTASTCPSAQGTDVGCRSYPKGGAAGQADSFRCPSGLAFRGPALLFISASSPV